MEGDAKFPAIVFNPETEVGPKKYLVIIDG